MGLFCTLRGHEADAAKIVWNGGICFGTCARCGSDLVRTIRDRWQVPRGYKVVWRAAPKADPEPVPSEPAGWAAIEPKGRLDWDIAEPALAPEPDAELPMGEPAAEAAEEYVVPDHVAVETSQAVEWPLDTSVVEAATELSSDALAIESAATPPEPGSGAPAVPDFMDDWVDDMNWDDFPDQRQTAAAG